MYRLIRTIKCPTIIASIVYDVHRYKCCVCKLLMILIGLLAQYIFTTFLMLCYLFSELKPLFNGRLECQTFSWLKTRHIFIKAMHAIINTPHLFNLYSWPDNLNQSQESKFLSLEHTPLEHTPLEHTPLEHSTIYNTHT
jgi:hypothetical protein